MVALHAGSSSGLTELHRPELVRTLFLMHEDRPRRPHFDAGRLAAVRAGDAGRRAGEGRQLRTVVAVELCAP